MSGHVVRTLPGGLRVVVEEIAHVRSATIGVWEDESGVIVGVALCEDQRRSEAFLLRHPAYGAILDEMIAYAEEHLRPPEHGTLCIPVYDDDTELQAALRRRGYAPRAEHPGYDSLHRIETPRAPCLPDGFVVRSMADERDIDQRREIFGRAFNHVDPREWPSALSYEELERAPDYCPDLDLYVVAPDGTYVSCCIVWWDAVNGMGVFEPVGTHPAYRRRGLGRAVVWEGIRRVAALGADRCWVGSGQRFYEAIGFRKELVSYHWTKDA